MAVLEVKELTKVYGSGENQVTALDHVSFQVKKGERLGILGLNGAGKSTLLKI
ncbi:MAG: ATP-binding cassette domain-containing protein, partial [Lachnospiraceae bacterium]|nr:ATP-binding cassette domain-containing protein [Lachnospiraceae bacterium]